MLGSDMTTFTAIKQNSRSATNLIYRGALQAYVCNYIVPILVYMLSHASFYNEFRMNDPGGFSTTV